MEETLEDFVGSFVRDSPEALPISTSLGLDDSQGPLDVQLLRSSIGPPTPRPVALKSSKGKSTKDPPTLEEGESVDTPSTKRDTSQRPEALSKGEHFGKKFVVPFTDREEESDDDVDDAQSENGLREDEEGNCGGNDA
ncbi:hypothetical protein LIER_30477 [Lithospermum erythrorhizon]|uniref:Uncharacterized protein n=1 Tax=Lithospermum erythrorhizon TaxID=34254 RepID=A0AAV3RRD6_LITER